MTIEVYRDAWGIPHLRADNHIELAYAQGYNVAMDRGWQIEVERHRMLGTSAAFLGPESLDWDVFARRAFLEDTARLCFRRLEPSTRDWVRAYTAGVNAGLQKTEAPEFSECKINPGRWSPWTSLGIWLSTHILLGSFPSKLWREELAQTLGEDRIALFATDGLTAAGSNGWLIPPQNSQSNAAILAGDPHRLIEEPGVYQQIHLSCPEYDVVGFAVPGVPGIAHFGHTGSVAWAITNAMADCQDLYQEKLRRRDKNVEALGANGFEVTQTYHESIEVLGAEAVAVELIETERGPVIIGGPDQEFAISLRHPPRARQDLGFDALPKLLRAKTVADVNEAMGQWVEPVNVIQAADKNGDTLYRLAGAIPRRNSKNGLRIVPAWEPQFAWQGFHDKLPVQAPDEISVMANQRELAAEFGVEFAPPHRAQRIRELLAKQQRWSASDMAAILTDTYLPSAQTLLEPLNKLQHLSSNAEAIRNRLLNWDKHMDGSSCEAALYAELRAAVVRRIAAHPTFQTLAQLIHKANAYPSVFNPWLALIPRVAFALENLLAHPDLWCTDQEPTSMISEAIEELAAPPDSEKKWAELHRLSPWQVLPHNPDEGWPGVSGDHDCVLSTYSVPGITHLCIRGPAARFVWDLADRDNSLWVVPIGASGLRSDSCHHNQLSPWLNGQLLPVVTDWQQLQRETRIAYPSPNSPVYERFIASLGTLRIVPIQPEKDLDLIYSWVTQERAKFWGMQNHSRDYVLEIYDYLDAHPTQNAYLIYWDNKVMGIFQTYDPQYDAVGACYAVEPGDIGFHLLMASATKKNEGLVILNIIPTIINYLCSDPSVKRIIAEPDIRNKKAITRAIREGFTLGPTIQLPEKQAQMLFYYAEPGAESSLDTRKILEASHY